ncbi:MAG: GNAT family N-acetyltransferase [Actinomycetota bacterium]
MIRRYDEADAEAVLALNAACVPEVGPMDADKLAGFAEWAPYFKVVEYDGRIVALLVGLGEDAPYGSPNFGWFADRYPLFAYIDRVAVTEDQRGAGWGPALYRDFEEWAVDTQKPMLCAEVNVEPPNPRSLRFHEISGFESVEQFEPTGSPDYRVAMLVKKLG